MHEDMGFLMGLMFARLFVYHDIVNDNVIDCSHVLRHSEHFSLVCVFKSAENPAFVLVK